MASRKINQRSREKPPIKPFLPILEESGNRPQFLAEQRLGGDKRVEFSKGAQYMFQGPRRSHDSNSIQCRFLQESRWEGYEPPSSYSKGTRKYTRRSRARGYGRPKKEEAPRNGTPPHLDALSPMLFLTATFFRAMRFRPGGNGATRS